MTTSVRLILVLFSFLAFATPARPAAADPPRDPDTYVLLARELLFLGANGLVESGNVGVIDHPGVFAKIGEGARLEDASALASSNVLLDAFTSVDDVFVNSLKTQPSSAIRGAVSAFGTVPLLVLDPLPAFAPTREAVEVPTGGSLDLPPGSYGKVTVRKSATLVLTGGLYDLDDLKVLDDASVRAAGPVEVRIARRLRFNSRTFVGPMPGSGLAPQDIVLVTGARSVRVGQSFTMLGRVIAPVASFNSRNALTVSGQIVARRIQLHPGSTLRLATGGDPTPTPAPTPSTTPTPGGPTPTAGMGTCGDGVVDTPGEQCDDGNLTNGDGCSSTCKIEVGEVCSFTPGGWGARCAGDNPGCRRDAGFASAFPAGLLIGDQAGHDGPAGGFAALWTTPQAIEAYLPAGGKAGALTADLTNPSSTPAGVLGGHLVAAKLNVAIAGTPANLRLLGCVHPQLRNLTIGQLIALADQAVATGSLPAGLKLSDLTQALDAVNNNFDDCEQNLGCLGTP
jgi:cysteine-rich repeat protein